MKRILIKKLLRILLDLDNRIHFLISKYSVKHEGGLHPKHRLTGYHDFFLKNIRPGDDVLDIGCGNGYGACRIADKAGKVTGIDIGSENIKIAQKKYFRDNIEYISGYATVYLFNKKFDVIILSNVLEHIEDRVRFLEKAKNLCKKYLIRVPMKDRDWKVLFKEELGIENRLDKTHFIEYTINSFREELEEAGLAIQYFEIRFGEIWSVVIKRYESEK